MVHCGRRFGTTWSRPTLGHYCAVVDSSNRATYCRHMPSVGVPRRDSVHWCSHPTPKKAAWLKAEEMLGCTAALHINAAAVRTGNHEEGSTESIRNRWGQDSSTFTLAS